MTVEGGGEDSDNPTDDELLGMQTLLITVETLLITVDRPNVTPQELTLLESLTDINSLADQALHAALGRGNDPNVEDVLTRFEAWADARSLGPEERFSEKPLIVFFSENYFDKRAPSTFFPHLSNLQAAIAPMYPQIDFKKFHNLRRLLKSKCDNYLTTKARPMTDEQIEAICKITPNQPRLCMTLAAIVIAWYGQLRPIEAVRLNQSNVERIQAGPDAGGYLIRGIRLKRGAMLNHFVVPPGTRAAVLQRWFDQLPPEDHFSAGEAPLFFASRTTGGIDFTRRAHKNFLNRCVKFLFETFWKKDATNWTGYSPRRGAITHMADSNCLQTHDIESAAGWKRGSKQLFEYRQTSQTQLHNKAHVLSSATGRAEQLAPLARSSATATALAEASRPAATALLPAAAPLLPPVLAAPVIPAGASAATSTAAAAFRRAQQSYARAAARLNAASAADATADLAVPAPPSPSLPLAAEQPQPAVAAPATRGRRRALSAAAQPHAQPAAQPPALRRRR
jgi:integrase